MIWNAFLRYFCRQEVMQLLNCCEAQQHLANIHLHCKGLPLHAAHIIVAAVSKHLAMALGSIRGITERGSPEAKHMFLPHQRS